MIRHTRIPCTSVLALVAVGSAACSGRDAPSNDGEAASSASAYDWLVSGGLAVDGTGAPARRADLLVRGDRIAFLGIVDPDTIVAHERFDATGLVVTPGFIDAHAHGDPVENGAFPNFLAMGVTTILLGQDGGGPEVGGLAEHFDAVDAAAPGVNVAYQVGHNTIRLESGTGYDAAGPEDMVRMSELVAEGLAAGAFGLSTGLEYDPGSRSGPDELAAIAAPVAAVGGVVSSHMRTEDAGEVRAALAELIEQGRRSGARVHAAHLKIVLEPDTARAAELLEMMATARADGIEVTADVYPYTASYTGIGILFPDWARPPNDYDAVVAERRDELAAHLRRRVESRNGPEATLFGSGEWAGRTLADIAAEQERPFEQVLLEMGPGGASAAYFVMSDAVMQRLLLDPATVVSTDGSPTMLHPRGYGSFARVLRKHVVGDGSLRLEEAVRKMSGATAAIFRLDDPAVVETPRGRLSPGWAADLLVFDPAEIDDPADFTDPHRPATGMRLVMVNGAIAWRDGRPVEGPGGGRLLRARW